jgi:hypothetical protein
MNDLRHPPETWTLEILFVLAIGLPWYLFCSDVLLAVCVHAGVAAIFLVLELAVLGRGSAVVSFLVVVVLSTLAGILLIGTFGGRLGS